MTNMASHDDELRDPDSSAGAGAPDSPEESGATGEDAGTGGAEDGGAEDGGAEDGGAEDGGLDGLETLEELLGEDARKLAAERDEYLDSLRRLQADFDNFRKRVMRQQTELLERASEGLVVQLLPVLDALDLAIAHAGEAEEGDDDRNAREALVQIGTLLRDTLAREGVERIDEVGVSFDPTVHDAVAHEAAGEESEDGDPHPQEVAEVLRAGYRLKGRVIRPAMVKVKG